MIYFDGNYQACAFEVENPVATVEEDVWSKYCEYERGTAWDIKNGQFVQLVSVEDLGARKEAERRIAELKRELDKTDYQAIKYSEGELTAEEYAKTKENRKAWRAEINSLQEQYGL